MPSNGVKRITYSDLQRSMNEHTAWARRETIENMANAKKVGVTSYTPKRRVPEQPIPGEVYN